MEEPSVLDYLKAKLTPWRGPAPQIPPLEGEAEAFPERDVGRSLLGCRSRRPSEGRLAATATTVGPTLG